MELLLLSLILITGPTLAEPLRMQPIGAYCVGYGGDASASNATACAETTPFLWRGLLHVAEHHSAFRIRRQALPGCEHSPGGCVNDMVVAMVPGTTGISFVSAIVTDAPETLWLFGTNDDALGAQPRTQVHTFWSTDLISWNTTMVLQLPHSGSPPKPPSWDSKSWTGFNTSPARGVLNGTDVFVLAIELGSPAALIGTRFTSVFAICEQCARTGDLSAGWTILDPTSHIYRRDRYSACPTLRYFNGYFYLVTLYEGVPNPKGAHCNSDSSTWDQCLAEHIVRSKDLMVWEESPYGGNQTILMGLPDGKDLSGPDHRIIPGSLLDQFGTPAEKNYTQSQTDDINRSDMDMVTLASGETYVVWLSGNQGVGSGGNPAGGASVAGMVKGTEQEWLESYFE